MLACCLPMKSRKRLAPGASDVFTTHSGIVHDVTDADCWAENGGTHDPAFTLGFQTSVFNKQKYTQYLLYLSKHSLGLVIKLHMTYWWCRMPTFFLNLSCMQALMFPLSLSLSFFLSFLPVVHQAFIGSFFYDCV